MYSLLLGFSAITLKADQTIGGTALNMMATAFAIVVVKAFNNANANGSGASSAKLTYDNSAFIYKLGPVTINIFLIIGIIILICSHVFLFRTKWGLRLRACGEHPQAADSVGINVYQWRYIGVMISGVLGGIRWFRIHRTVCYYLELRGWCGRCRIPGFSSYDLWTVEAVPDRSCGCVLCSIPFFGEYCGLHGFVHPWLV